jgi:hypothetical protein
MNVNSLAYTDEDSFTEDDHFWLANRLCALRATLVAVEQEDATLKPALEDALRLIKVLQAGLIWDHMVSHYYLPPYLVEEFARPLSHPRLTQIVADAQEIGDLIEAKATRDCIVATGYHLVAAVKRVQEIAGHGRADEVPLHQAGDEKRAASASHPEYQQVAEHLAALGVFLQVLHQTSFMPAAENAWGLTAEELEADGYPPEGQPASFSMIDFWETSTIDELNWCQLTVVHLFYAISQHALSGGGALDLEKMDRARRDFQACVAEVDPNYDLHALVPIAGAIQKILAAVHTCSCIRTAVTRLAAAMGQLAKIYSLAARPQTH